MQKLTYYIACSVDGFIAHNDGSHAGFSEDLDYLQKLFAIFPDTVPTHFRAPLGITAENQWFDTVLMGRGTYEVGLKEGISSPYSHLKQFVFSKSLSISPDTQVKLIRDSATDCVKQLKAEPGKGIWLCGGGKLASSLLHDRLIDRVILKVNPFVMGQGIPLFDGSAAQTALRLNQQQMFENGVLLLYYDVHYPT